MENVVKLQAISLKLFPRQVVCDLSQHLKEVENSGAGRDVT
jgi:hypothetical protein